MAAQSSEHWMSLLDMYTQVAYDAEKRKMLLGLASTQDVRHIAWYGLQFACVQVLILRLVRFLRDLIQKDFKQKSLEEEPAVM